MEKIAFKKQPHEEWFAEVGETEIWIEKHYFGRSHWYQVYINDKFIGQEDTLNKAKELARMEIKMESMRGHS